VIKNHSPFDGLDMRVKVLIFLILMIIIDVKVGFSDCSPGVRYTMNNNPEGYLGPWSGQNVPYYAGPYDLVDNNGVKPSNWGFPGNYKYYNLMIHINDGLLGNANQYFAGKTGHRFVYGNSGGFYWQICTRIESGNCYGYSWWLNHTVTSWQSLDYDCDGTLDQYDNTPTYGANDSDGDGIIDNLDPWPNDPNLPGNIKFQKSLRYVRKSDGKYIQIYVDEADPMNENHWFYSTNGGININDVNDNDYRVELTITGEAKTFSQWNFGEGQDNYSLSNLPENTIKEGSFSSVSGSSRSGGSSGTANYGNVTDTDLKILADYLSAIQSNTGGVVEGLNNLIAAQNKLGGDLAKLALNQNINNNVNVDMSGVEQRLDQISNKIPSMGQSSEVPEASQNNFNVGQDEINNLYESEYASEKSSLSSYVSNWLNNNPLKSLISSSGVQVGSGSCKLNVSFGNFNFDLDFCPAESYLNVMGYLLVAFAGLLGLVEVVRG